MCGAGPRREVGFLGLFGVGGLGAFTGFTDLSADFLVTGFPVFPLMFLATIFHSPTTAACE